MNSPPGADLTRGGRGVLIWGVPIAVLAVSANLGGLYPAVAWPLALTFMGAACLVNARHCGRRHCYFTGPYFLLLALLSLLYGLGVLDLGKRGWSWLSVALLVGGVVLICVPEWLFGRYVPRGGGGQAP
jgi:hypothetical protein